MKKYSKEACVDSRYQALDAQNQGADRIELCSQLEYDGLTPSEEDVDFLTASLDIPVRVMIRPRKGNFIYTPDELREMLSTIQKFKKYPVEGYVIGALTPQLQPDIDQVNRLADACYPAKITFHKAIDVCTDIIQATYTLMNHTPVDTILTSGGCSTAWEGRTILKKMIRIATPKVTIMPAGSITSANVEPLNDILNARWYHGKRITSYTI